MYLWKADSLVNDFKSGKVSQTEEFKYALLFTIAIAIASDPAIHIGASYNYYDTISSVLMLCISVVGIYSCYKINSSGDNRDFIVRIMCIGLPVMVRVVVVFIPVLIVGFIIEDTLFETPANEEAFESTPTQVILMSSFLAAYYWYLSKHIRAVSS